MVIIGKFEFTYQDYLNYCDSFYCHGTEEIIDESEGEDNMLNAKRIIDEEFRKERRDGKIEGILEGIKQTIERMIKMNFKDEVIQQATGAKESEIEQIRENMKQVTNV